MKITKTAGVLVLFLLALSACGPTRVVRLQTPSDKKLVYHDARVLKVYMTDGSLYVLDEWVINDFGNTVTGTGRHVDVNRNLVSFKEKVYNKHPDVYEIYQDDITLVETNRLKNHGGTIAQLTLVGAYMGLVTAALFSLL